jgi:glycosyltransferase involved in cell wall biosynthesis
MTTLSVVMPVHDEGSHLPETIEALLAAVARSGFDRIDLVLVDDGSTDGSAAVVREAVGDGLPLTVVTQPNQGRFAARRAGLEAATGDSVLLLDGRVRLDPDALAFVRTRLEGGEHVWNGHVEVDVDWNPFGAFSNLLVELAWREYFADPRTTSYGVEEFDRYPKGTTCFLAPRSLLMDAVSAYSSGYADLRHANDDTPLIRWIATRERIHLSPRFRVGYRPRSTLSSFVRHSFHRGVVFLDGHGRRESRYFPAVVAFFPISATLALASSRRPLLAPSLAAACAAAAGVTAAAAGRSAFETASFAALMPVYAIAHGAGMWRGLGLAARARLASGSTA